VFFFVLPDRAFINDPDKKLVLNVINAQNAIYLIALVVTFLGLIVSFREISKEMHIYDAERREGVAPLAHLLSHWLWLILTVALPMPILLQVLLFLVYRQPLSADPTLAALSMIGITGTLFLTAVAAISLGLAASAIAGTDNNATILLAGIAIMHILLSGVLVDKNSQTVISSLAIGTISHWGVVGISANVGLYCWFPNLPFEYYNSLGATIAIWIALAVYSVTAVAVAWLALALRGGWSWRVTLLHITSQNARRLVIVACVLSCCIGSVMMLQHMSYQYHKRTVYDATTGRITVVDGNAHAGGIVAAGDDFLNGYICPPK
jgi:hypothetical protein